MLSKSSQYYSLLSISTTLAQYSLQCWIDRSSCTFCGLSFNFILALMCSCFFYQHHLVLMSSKSFFLICLSHSDLIYFFPLKVVGVCHQGDEGMWSECSSSPRIVGSHILLSYPLAHHLPFPSLMFLLVIYKCCYIFVVPPRVTDKVELLWKEAPFTPFFMKVFGS